MSAVNCGVEPGPASDDGPAPDAGDDEDDDEAPDAMDEVGDTPLAADAVDVVEIVAVELALVDADVDIRRRATADLVDDLLRATAALTSELSYSARDCSSFFLYISTTSRSPRQKLFSRFTTSALSNSS